MVYFVLLVNLKWNILCEIKRGKTHWYHTTDQLNSINWQNDSVRKNKEPSKTKLIYKYFITSMFQSCPF